MGRNILASTMALLFCVSMAQAGADTFGTGANQFTIDFVTISGDASSANGTNISGVEPDNSAHKVFVDPGQPYRMGTFEVTNDQYNKFAAELGVPVMGGDIWAYDEDPYYLRPNEAYNNTSWYEAAQFVNWLNTSAGHQPAYNFTGTQGTSSYTFAVWDPAEAAGGTNLYRHKDAFYYLPTEQEWVKAAYWNGSDLQTYANASPNDLVPYNQDIDFPDPTKWNYSRTDLQVPWDVGTGAKELNGTYDMMGNNYEWMEGPLHEGNYDVGSSSYRNLRGGSFGGGDGADKLAMTYRFRATLGANEVANFGFRVASNVPEPTTMSLLGLGGLMVLKRRKR
jgi:formylglycine-generating enzyme